MKIDDALAVLCACWFPIYIDGPLAVGGEIPVAVWNEALDTVRAQALVNAERYREEKALQRGLDTVQRITEGK